MTQTPDPTSSTAAEAAPSAATPVAAPTSAAPRYCANCGAPLHGGYCYTCGQPIKGMIRPLSSMVHDIADTIFNIDSRIFRTLLPLLLKPGYLSNEYFAGRRVRYVTPFRLYFFLSVAAFLLMQSSLDTTLDLARDMVHVDSGEKSIASAMTVEEVEARRDAVLAQLEKTRESPAMPESTTKRLEKASTKVRAEADKRVKYLKQAEEAKAAGAQAPADPDSDDEGLNFRIDDHDWDPKTNPIHVDWLPAFANAKINASVERMKENIPRIRKDPKPFLIGAFSTLPQVLFVLMPLFALLLKVFYLFKRRLYMEHLIVALHSHSFLFFALFLLTLVGLAHGWAHDAAPWLYAPLGWIMFVLGWWMPIYLFWMQKKVYRQGWFLTTVKYCAIGLCYTIMVSFGVAAAFVVSLATT
jgi:Protein of unknown function (DUF3667)